MGIFLLTNLVLADAKTGKIPVTTSSQEALDYFLKGRDLSDKLRVTESRTYFEKAVQADPDFAMGYVFLAQAQPTFEGYFKYFDMAREHMGNISEGEKLWIQGLNAGNNADPLGQRKAFQRLTELYPEDERGFTLLGNNYFGQQEYEMAIKQYNKAIAINPDYSQPYNQMGYSYRFLGDYEKARQTFEKYIELIPDDPNPYDSYAELLMKMGEYRESIKYYEKALAINPEFMASHIGIATDYNFLNQHENARSRAQKILDLAHDNGQRRTGYFAMAVSFVDEGKYDRALDMLDKQYALAESDKDYASMAADLNAEGLILMEMGDYDRAAAKFEESLAMRKSASVSSENMAFNEREKLYYDGFVALMKGEFETAAKKSTLYLQGAEKYQNPFQIRRAHELDGMIALKQAQYDKAVTELEKANMQNPYNIYRMAQAFEGLGKAEKSLRLYKEAANFNSLNDINLAFIRERAGQTVAGIE